MCVPVHLFVLRDVSSMIDKSLTDFIFNISFLIQSAKEWESGWYTAGDSANIRSLQTCTFHGTNKNNRYLCSAPLHSLYLIPLQCSYPPSLTPLATSPGELNPQGLYTLQAERCGIGECLCSGQSHITDTAMILLIYSLIPRRFACSVYGPLDFL